MTESRTYIATPPGETIKEQLEDRNMIQKEFAERMGYSPKHISKLINGEAPLTQQTAQKLEMVFGIPAVFWTNLEAIYRDKLSKAEEENQMDADTEVVKNFPYSEISRHSWVPQTNDKNERVINLRKFFEVTELRLLEKEQITKIACRRLKVTDKSDAALLTWAQKAKREARKRETSPINIVKLKTQLPTIRSMTLQEPRIFMPQLTTLLANCGIALIVLPHLEGSGLQGVVFKDGNKIVLGTTLRGKYADKFWFSLFHELGHIMLEHIKHPENLTEEDEEAANQWAADHLISQDDFQYFISKNDFSQNAIQDFAHTIGIAPGILVGRLQKEQFIKYNQLNSLKVKYVFG